MDTTRASTMDSWFHRGNKGDTKTSATTSTASNLASPLRPTQNAVENDEEAGPRTDQIHATTTIAQTYWRNDLYEMAGNATDTELGGVDQGPVTSQAWADAPGAGSYGGFSQHHQR